MELCSLWLFNFVRNRQAFPNRTNHVAHLQCGWSKVMGREKQENVVREVTGRDMCRALSAIGI